MVLDASEVDAGRIVLEATTYLVLLNSVDPIIQIDGLPILSMARANLHVDAYGRQVAPRSVVNGIINMIIERN